MRSQCMYGSKRLFALQKSLSFWLCSCANHYSYPDTFFYCNTLVSKNKKINKHHPGKSPHSSCALSFDKTLALESLKSQLHQSNRRALQRVLHAGPKSIHINRLKEMGERGCVYAPHLNNIDGYVVLYL